MRFTASSCPRRLWVCLRKMRRCWPAGCVYLRSYSFDTLFAAVHFCFSGYFCGDQKAGISFIHNIIAIVLIRIPGAYLAGVYFPDSLYPMGWAAPLGSLLSALICIGFYVYFGRKEKIRI